MNTALNDIFDSYANGSIFKNKSVLQLNYTPETIPHRGKQIEAVASILAPALRGERVSNLFIYGKTGCIAGDSLVYTDNGWKKIKDVNHKTDKVLSFNINAKIYEWSNFIFLRFENKDKLLKITLHNGYELILTKDHPLLTPSTILNIKALYKPHNALAFFDSLFGVTKILLSFTFYGMEESG